MSSVEPRVDEEVEAPEEAATPADDPYAAILDTLKTELGDDLVESYGLRDDLWVRVSAGAWVRTAEVLRHQLGFDYFCFLSGIDWMPHTWPNPKVVEGEGAEDEEAAEPEPSTEIETGYAGGGTRFQVFARVYSTARHRGLTVKADLDDAAPAVGTWREVYAGADWHERETWEMYGFDFTGHPNLAHLYLPGAFEGFPLRKDFPLLSREVKPWPGLVDVEQFPAGYQDPAEASSDEPAASTEEGDAG